MIKLIPKNNEKNRSEMNRRPEESSLLAIEGFGNENIAVWAHEVTGYDDEGQPITKKTKNTKIQTGSDAQFYAVPTEKYRIVNLDTGRALDFQMPNAGGPAEAEIIREI